MSVPEGASPFADAPAPWHCSGEAFWFFGHISSKKGSYPPSSAFNDAEAASSFSDAKASGEYHGGLTSLMLVRYKDTPVGPYDELIWIPGAFSVPQTSMKKLRITRIYVSAKESVYNGRKNWNIPKTVAHFEFTPNPKATSPDVLPYSKITVSSPSDPEHPFFAINITPSRFLSKPWLPYDSSWTPLDTYLVQPPLPESPKWREDALIGTNRWWGIDPLMKGKAAVIWGEGGLEGDKYGDNVGIPDLNPWKMGLWLKDFMLDFPTGEEIGGDKKTD
ncbi:hypothetical protein QCA50_004885 [Cerrena zonata]|uniref:Uncharacterized protein n=1 Tax=Cerrena zonata TaxID=2478898 RepID=A0AAW0GPQ6_9APHY